MLSGIFFLPNAKTFTAKSLLTTQSKKDNVPAFG